jgi:lipopolysaccharide/colanic/teichoic acid biosynthesis glycosyltransferase
MDAKPGITGIWQVYGRSITDFANMVRMDINYIERQSLLLDLKLMVLTPFAVFSARGAV